MSSEIFIVIGKTLLFMFFTISMLSLPINLILILVFKFMKKNYLSMRCFIFLIIGILSTICLNIWFI